MFIKKVKFVQNQAFQGVFSNNLVYTFVMMNPLYRLKRGCYHNIRQGYFLSGQHIGKE
jgi:hypothetical protein